MMGQTTGCIEKTVKCTAAIGTAYTIAKFGADDDTLSAASAATDALVGVFQHITAAVGDAVRVMLDGISRAKLGGTVTRGSELTSDAYGRAVAATLAEQSRIGIALASGVEDDIVPILILPRKGLSAAAASKDVVANAGQIATTGNLDVLVVAPETGVLAGVDFVGEDALDANDTNYVTFSVTNKGQAGAGSTAMLAAADANTTKATGGAAIGALARKALTLHGTPANLVVAKGDVLQVRAAASGTLANAVDRCSYMLRFGSAA
jgi:hypothetical protein